LFAPTIGGALASQHHFLWVIGLDFSQCGNRRPGESALGHELPRRPSAGAAGLPQRTPIGELEQLN